MNDFGSLSEYMTLLIYSTKTDNAEEASQDYCIIAAREKTKVLPVNRRFDQ